MPWRPTLDFKMAAVKPVVALTVALVNILASFQMLAYAFTRLTDSVDGSSLVSVDLENITLAIITSSIYQWEPE